MKATITGNPETVFIVIAHETIEAASGMKLKASATTHYFDEYADAYEYLMQIVEGWTVEDDRAFENKLHHAIICEDGEPYNTRNATIHLCCDNDNCRIKVKRCEFVGMTLER